MNRRYGILLLAIAVLMLDWGYDVRAHLSLCVAERHRAAGGGGWTVVNQALPLGCSPGRGAPEKPMSITCKGDITA